MVLIGPDQTILEQDMSASSCVGIIEGHGGVQQPCQEVLTADFTIDPVTVVFGNTIFFDDDCLGDPISWNWTFEEGDPATSTDTAVTVLYNTVGTWAVTLEISDGTDTHTKIDYVHIVEPGAPVPDFTATETIINVGESIDFLDLTTDGPESWDWTFVGGTPIHSTDQNPTGITYNIPGVFNVYLNTANAWGTSYHTKYAYITVLADEPPIEVCDTVTNLLPLDPLIVEQVSPWGVIPGANSYNINEYAEFFENSDTYYDQVSGIRAWVNLAVGASSNASVRFKVFDGDVVPTTLLGYKDVNIQDIASNFVLSVIFDDPISLSGNFFIGYQVNTISNNDQFAVSMAADRGPGELSTMFVHYNNNWYPSNSLSVVNNISSSLALEPIACNTTGINNITKLDDEIDIYPNPSGDFVNVSFGDNYCSECTMRIYNMMGDIISLSKEELSSNTTRFDFSDSPNGVYFINIITNGKSVTKKVIISR